MKNLKDLDLKGKTVFYRPDYNVPVEHGEIGDDFRIQATAETLDYLIGQGAKVVIGAHMGRPDGQYVAELDMRIVAQYLADVYPDHVVRLAHEIKAPEVTAALEEMEAGDILMLPNLRFYPGEEKNSKPFAKDLATLADVYVNDAFACDHRAHASIVGVAELLPSAAGFLLEKEIENLSALITEPKSPFVVIMGGAKVSDKIEVIKNLAKKADHILVGGAMANTFLLARGEEISNSVAEPDKVDVAKQLMEELGEKLVIAVDFVKGDEKKGDFRYLDIGEKSVDLFKEYLSKAKTIFWNGSLGFTQEEEFRKASQEIAQYIATLKATSIIAGGDTVETLTNLGLRDAFSFVSTGGGAALEFLAGEVLPGVKVLE